MNTTHDKASRFVLVAGIDASPYAENVLANATANVRGRPSAELHLVHVLDLGGRGPQMGPLLREARAYLTRAGQNARDTCGARVTTHLALGRPWREIVQTAANVHADLVLVGTHGRTGPSRLLLGSQAELVVREASCPVLVVRAKDYASSVAELGPNERIEPACPECLEVQEQTLGERLWCARHSEHHPRASLHYEFPESFGRGTMLLNPE